MAMHMVWEALNTCQLWYCPPRVLHALKTLPSRVDFSVLGVSDFELYYARIKRTNWSQVPSVQSSHCLRYHTNHDLSPGRASGAGDFVWLDPRTAQVVDRGCAKRHRAQSYGPKPGNMVETTASDTEPRVKRWCCDEAPQTDSFCTAKSVADVIVIDYSKNSKATPDVDILTNSLGMGNGAPGPDLPESMEIEAVGRVDIRDALCGDVHNEA